jgi:peroxiredoxin
LQIRSKTSTMHLEDLPLDIGYASEQVTLTDAKGVQQTIGGHNGKTQLIITSPFIDEAFTTEMKKISEIIPSTTEHEVESFLIVANDSHENPNIENFSFLIDSDGEFGDFYGVRLKGEPYDNELTKAIILISKDGAIYYDQYCEDLENEFNVDILYRKILAAQLCYTGKGCH